MGGLGDKFKKGEKRVEKLFHRKPKEKSPQPSDASASSGGTPTGGVQPFKPMLNVEAPPDKPSGKPAPDVGKIDGVNAQPKPAEGGEKAPKPSTTEQTDMTKGENTAMAGGPSQGAKDAVAAHEGDPEGATATPKVDLPPTPDDRLIPASTVVLGLLVLWGLGFLLMIELFPPRWSELVLWALLFGLPSGIGFSFWKHKNEQHKIENNEKLNVYPGLKGLKEMLGEVPAWINYEEKERVPWLNSILTQMWPYYDPAICAAVKESVEPLLDAYKPPGLIKKIYFKTLTFGDAPFIFDNIWVDKSSQEEVCLEVSFRWAGQANIALAIEPIVSLGNVLRMVPKVSNLRMSGVFRIIMKPLIDDVPVCAGMVVAMKAPPQIKFTLEVGKQVGGAVVVKPILAWLDPFLRHTLTDMLVWPNRIVVPLHPDPNFDYSVLEMRHVGLLTVEVVEARGLKKYDVLGKSDPFVELSTLPLSKEKTSIKKKTLTPTWNETKHVLIQEPTTQFLRVEMFDHDLFQPKELLNLNIIKGATEVANAQELMGRSMIELKKMAAAPCQEVDDWYDLGKGEWSNPDGCGQGEGEIHLRLTYTPFEMFGRHPSESVAGALLVRLVKADELPAKDGTTSDPFVTFKLGSRKEQKSWVISATLTPTWNQKFEWLNVDATEELAMEVIDDDMIGDELLGKLRFNLPERLQALPHDCRIATWDEAFPLTDVAVCDARKVAPPAKLHLKIQWVPYTYRQTGAQAQTDAAHRHGRLHGMFHSKQKQQPAVVEASAASASVRAGKGFDADGPDVAALGLPGSADTVATHNDPTANARSPPETRSPTAGTGSTAADPPAGPEPPPRGYGAATPSPPATPQPPESPSTPRRRSISSFIGRSKTPSITPVRVPRE